MKTLAAPTNKPSNIPSTAKWLAGEGCGSWFHINPEGGYFIVSRYNPSGKLECTGRFIQTAGSLFIEEIPYEFTYLSHCAEVCLLQNNQKIHFQLIARILNNTFLPL